MYTLGQLAGSQLWSRRQGLCHCLPNEGSIRMAATPRKSNLRRQLWNAATSLIPRERPYRE